MMLTIFRDLGFFAISLVFYEVLLFKGIIFLHEALGILGFLGIYVFVIVQMNGMWKERMKAMKKEEDKNKEGNDEEEVDLLVKNEDNSLMLE